MGDDNIDKKRKKLENLEKGKTHKRKPNWVGFAYGCLFSILICGFCALISVNFIYFTCLSDQDMNKFFPSEFDEYFTNLKYDKSDKLKNLGIPPNIGWPYTTQYTKNLTFDNWLAFSTAEVYSRFRKMVKQILQLFGPENEILATDIVKIIFIISLFPLFLSIPLLSIPFMIFSICRNNYNHLFDPSNWLHWVYALFVPLMANFLYLGLSSIILIQFCFTLMGLPIFADISKVSSILQRNSKVFVTLLLICITINAIINKLNYAIIMALILGVIDHYISRLRST